MKRPLSTLIFVISFSVLSILAHSKHGAHSSPSPLGSPGLSRPLSPFPPPILSPSPSPFFPPRPHPRRSPQPHPRRSPRSTVPRNNIDNNQGPKFKGSHDKGKTVGLFFVGIAAVLQICVVGFLVFKRRQLLRSKDRYDGLS